jgi:hypothetical protein
VDSQGSAPVPRLAEIASALSLLGAVASIAALAVLGRWWAALCAAALVGLAVFLFRGLLAVKGSGLVLAVASAAVVLVVFGLANSRSHARRDLRSAQAEIRALRDRLAGPKFSNFAVTGVELNPTDSSF